MAVCRKRLEIQYSSFSLIVFATESFLSSLHRVVELILDLLSLTLCIKPIFIPLMSQSINKRSSSDQKGIMTKLFSSIIEFKYLSAIFSSIRVLILSSVSPETEFNEGREAAACLIALSKSWFQLASDLVELDKHERQLQMDSWLPPHSEAAFEKGEQAQEFAKRLCDANLMANNDAFSSSAESDLELPERTIIAPSKKTIKFVEPCTTPKRSKNAFVKKSQEGSELDRLITDLAIQKLNTLEVMGMENKFEGEIEGLKRKADNQLDSLSVRSSSAIQFAIVMSR